MAGRENPHHQREEGLRLREAPPSPPELPRFPPPNESRMIAEVFRRFPEENAEAVMGFIRDNLPMKMREFRALSERHGDRAMEFLTDVILESLDLVRIRRDRPDLFEKVMMRSRIERRVVELAQQYRAAEKDERAALHRELITALERGFDLKQEIMLDDLAAMQTELASLKQLIDRRKENRAMIIQRKATEMTGLEMDLDW